MEACVRDARFDQTFKILLGEKGAEDRAISFLNAALRLKTDGDRIEHIQFLDPFKVSMPRRSIHFHVEIKGLCKTYGGQSFLFEMQRWHDTSRIDRWIQYTGSPEIAAERLHERAHTSQDNDVEQKNLYTGIPVKVIVIADFDSPELHKELKNSSDFVVDWNTCERKSDDVASRRLLSWTFLVLPRFSAALSPRFSAALSVSENRLDFTGKVLEAWLFLMTRKDCETVWVTKELVANDVAVAQGFYRISHLTSNEIDGLREGHIAFGTLLHMRQENYREGYAKGLAIAKKQKTTEMVRQLQRLGLSVEQIIHVTGFSILDIKESEIN